MSDLCGATGRTGRKCGRTAGWGTTHTGVGSCKLHGGSTPNGEQSAAVTLAKRELQAWAQPVPIHPHEALLKAVAFANGWFDYASMRVNDLLEADLVGPTLTVTTERTDLVALDVDDDLEPELVEGHTTKVVRANPQLHVWIRARDQAAEQMVRFAKVCHDARIDEREITLAEQQAHMLATVVRNVIAALGMSDHPEAAKIARRELERASGHIHDAVAA